jgi:tetratricopeptide (TPR) repeat protein
MKTSIKKAASAVCAMMMGVLLALPAAAQDRYQEAAEALQNGMAKRAAKLFEEVAAEGGDRQAAAWIGAAGAYNALGDRDGAVNAARHVFEVTEEAVPHALARREIAVALATGKRNADQQGELEGAVEGLRTFLRKAPADPLADALRRGLCQALTAADLARAVGRDPVVLDGAVGVTPPEKLHGPPPRPSKDARRRMKVRSTAVVQGLVDEDGCVSRVTRIDATEPFWAEIVERNFAQWVYRPAVQDGVPVPVLLEVTESYDGARDRGGRR